MRIATPFLKELIDHDGRLKSGPIGQQAILRMALDLREASEKIAQLESTIALREAAAKPRASVKRTLALVTEEVVTGRFGDPRADDYEERVEVLDVVGKKVDYRA